MPTLPRVNKAVPWSKSKKLEVGSVDDDDEKENEHREALANKVNKPTIEPTFTQAGTEPAVADALLNPKQSVQVKL